jgi:hypothetical protein
MIPAKEKLIGCRIVYVRIEINFFLFASYRQHGILKLIQPVTSIKPFYPVYICVF